MKFALISSFRCVYVRFIGCSIEWKEWFPKNSKKHFGIVLPKTNSKGDTNPLIFFLLIYFMVSKSIEANICKWSPIPVQMLYKLSELVFFSRHLVSVCVWFSEGFFALPSHIAVFKECIQTAFNCLSFGLKATLYYTSFLDTSVPVLTTTTMTTSTASLKYVSIM